MRIRKRNVFLILLVSLTSAPLFAQSDLSNGYLTSQTKINTFVQTVEAAGDLTAAVQTADGGYVTASRIDDTSFLVRRIKASGQKRWERRLNFDAPNSASIKGIAQTADGGFVLASQMGDICFYTDCGIQPPRGATLVKLRPNGTVAWKIITASGLYYSFSSVIPMSDGGVIAFGAGYDTLSNFVSWLIVRVTDIGDVVWEKGFDSIPAAVDGFLFISAKPTPDNGLIVAFPTTTKASYRANGIGVMKITNSGDVVWEKHLKARGFVFQSVSVTTDGEVIVVGTGKNSNKLKVAVLKADGTLSWKAAYSLKVPGGLISVSSPLQTPDGGFVLVGGTSNSGFVAKIDSARRVALQNTFGASGKSVFATSDGGLFLFGNSGLDLLVSKVNLEGIADCNFFQSLGETRPTSFGRLRIRDMNLAESDVSLEPLDFGLTAVVTNHQVSTVCQ